MTFPPTDQVPGLNISPLFKDPNGLFPVQPYTPNFRTKFSQTEDNITATSNLMFILVVTSATTQGKQIQAVPLTMVHTPIHTGFKLQDNQAPRNSTHYFTFTRMPLSSDHLPTTDLSLSLMMIQASFRPSLHISFPSY